MADSKESEAVKKFAPLPATGKISMWLEDYNDIFSDFDPRDYSERAISDDFLNESQKMFREKKEGTFELRLLVPQALRKEKDEEVIKKRLKGFFRTREREIDKKIHKTISSGVIFSTIGLILMVAAAFLAYLEFDSLISKFIVVIIEPAGWFLLWYGLDQLFYKAPEKKHEYSFFKKVSKAEIIFDSYQNEKT